MPLWFWHGYVCAYAPLAVEGHLVVALQRAGPARILHKSNQCGHIQLICQSDSPSIDAYIHVYTYTRTSNASPSLPSLR